MAKNYDELEFKIPSESEDYQECSDFVVSSIENIMRKAMDENRNKIIINTNLKLGLPMENINKIAGPFIEAWSFESLRHGLLKFFLKLLKMKIMNLNL